MPDFLSFNDGIAEIYTVENIADPGDKPKDGLIQKYRLNFGYKTIGTARNYNAMQANVRLDEMIETPQRRDVSTQNIVVIDDRQYEINQVQHINNTKPPCSRYSLTRLEVDYDIKRV